MKAGNEKISLTSIFDRDTVLHLRIPFSFFLLPVFCFGISQCSVIHLRDAVVLFISLHLFLYPGSNCYNSYMDEDTGSIGGLEHPPPVTPRLYYASIIFDVAGLALLAFTGWQNMLLGVGYVAFSKAYSWHGIRLKKYAWPGWLSVMFFQGGYTYMMSNMIAGQQVCMTWFTPKNIECMLFASFIIAGSYPLTQVYQHSEDGERGDKTISYRLGIIGTFIFTMAFFTAGATVLFHYFHTYYSISQFIIFACALFPVIAYFSYWFLLVLKDRNNASYRYTMLMNRISALCMIICFTIIMRLNHIQYV